MESVDSKTLEFIEKAKKVYGDRYDYSETKYVGSKIPVKIICKNHGMFEKTPSKHLSGQGCPKCSIEKKKQIRVTFEEFVRRSSEVHSWKYSYPEQDWNGVLGMVTIICPIHGEFTQKASDHLNGHGCEKCAREKTNEAARKKEYRKTRPRKFDVEVETKKWIEKFRSVHGGFYDYSKVVYTGHNYDDATIICPKHGEFHQSFASHYSGSGCPRCWEEKIGEHFKLSQEEFIKRCYEVHGDRYDLSKVVYD